MLLSLARAGRRLSDGLHHLGFMTLLQKAQKKGSKFLNPVSTGVGDLSTILRVIPRYLTNRQQRSPNKSLGPFTTDPRVFHRPPSSGLRVTWFGHSSSLLEVDGLRLLIDPVWDERASPFQWTGPKRFFPPTLTLLDLPDLDVILISHDHYDHLGEATIRHLAIQPNARRALWVTSKGVGTILRSWGVRTSQIVELDWTESKQINDGGNSLKITCWPARHFSGRSLWNRFETLWASFAIEGAQHSVFYGADSGPWPGFAEIGAKYRGFDLTMIEIGAFDPLWADIHLGPDAAVAAFQAMSSSGLLMPIHWGLFDLALHAWNQPIERIRQIAREQAIPLWSPEPGLPTEVVRGVELQSDWWMGH